MAGIKDDSYFWIGLSDQNIEGEFEWEDGSPADFVNFLSSKRVHDATPYVILINKYLLLKDYSAPK